VTQKANLGSENNVLPNGSWACRQTTMFVAKTPNDLA